MLRETGCRLRLPPQCANKRSPSIGGVPRVSHMISAALCSTGTYVPLPSERFEMNAGCREQPRNPVGMTGFLTRCPRLTVRKGKPSSARPRRLRAGAPTGALAAPRWASPHLPGTRAVSRTATVGKARGRARDGTRRQREPVVGCQGAAPRIPTQPCLSRARAVWLFGSHGSVDSDCVAATSCSGRLPAVALCSKLAATRIGCT